MKMISTHGQSWQDCSMKNGHEVPPLDPDFEKTSQFKSKQFSRNKSIE